VCEREIKRKRVCARACVCVCVFACGRMFVNVHMHIQTSISPRTRLTLCHALPIVSTLPIRHIV